MLFSVFKQFLILGCLSFGGPAAHLGYFKKRFVDELAWLSADEYARIIALSQFLPGPGSSQTGFAIGYQRAGVAGGLLAFIGFTLPSVVIMLILAIFGSSLTQTSIYIGLVHGLKLLAVVVVADATYGMFTQFCQCRITQTLCILSAVFSLLFPSLFVQILVLLGAGMTGSMCIKATAKASTPHLAGRLKKTPMLLFGLCFLVLPWLASQHELLALASTFYHVGSLVFGGGHVVLPILQNTLDGQISSDSFLAGYAAAQAVPGPMFTLATWLGYSLSPTAPIAGALVATAMIFLPGFLLLVGCLQYWQKMSGYPRLGGAVKGINSAVTGFLLCALFHPVFNSAVQTSGDFAIILVGLGLLRVLNLPIIALVAGFIVTGALFL